jgi:phosphopantothenoylcysteine decarboxylase / phosphopantothenate---cysteine ligase
MPESIKLLEGKSVLFGVTGGIACYKAADVVRGLRGMGADVTVVMTRAATEFVAPLTFGALSGNPVLTGMFEDKTAGSISHIELTAGADVFLVAPATANVLGKMAAGIADDLLTTMLLAARCPILVAPAMNYRMYESPSVKRNIKTLKADGVRFIGPEKGPMACGEYGWGRMSEPADILDAVAVAVANGGLLSGRKVLVTAGPTVEDLDPVRFISNRSTGKMGYSIARKARDMGADVTLVSGPTSMAPPAGVDLISVRNADEMNKAVGTAAAKADVVIMAAAVSDYTPEKISASKIKKGADSITLKLVKTPDIISNLARKNKKGRVVIGFAAETENLEKNARGKLADKGLDMVAANSVGGDTGFATDYNRLLVYGKSGLLLDTGRVTKDAAASMLLGLIAAEYGFSG